MTMQEILQKAIEQDAADIFLVAGLPVTFKCGGRQERSPEGFLRPDDINALVDSVYEISHRSRANLENGIDDDFSFAVSRLGRFRVNVFRQRGSLAAVIRVIRFGLPDPVKLGIPESVLSLADNKKGLVLITDSIQVAHLPDGPHDQSGQTVIVDGIRCRFPDGTIAGSSLTMDLAVRNFRAHTGLPLYQVVNMASLYPARSVGVDGAKGSDYVRWVHPK